MADTTYNGWRNYSTWAVNLWLDNEQNTQEFWRTAAREAWEIAEKTPDPYGIGTTASATARSILADQMKDELDENMPEDIQNATANSMYADLLNHALGQVDWFELADAWLENAALDGYVPREAERAARHA